MIELFVAEVTQSTTEKKNREPQRNLREFPLWFSIFNSVALCGRRSCVTSYPQIYIKTIIDSSFLQKY